MLSLLLTLHAHAAWFYPGPGPEHAEIPASAHRTGALLARVDNPKALEDLGQLEVLGGDGHVVRLVPRGDEVLLSRALWARPDVAWAHPDLAFELIPAELPDDPFVTDQWHLANTGQGGRTPGVDIDAETAWAITTGRGALIAIIDTGADPDHPDLSIVSGWDYLDDDDDPSPDPDYSGYPHGTACAGLAAAIGDNGIGVAGVAYGADLHAVRFIGGTTTLSDLYDAFVDSVDAGAWVLSNSWGFTDDCSSFPTYSAISDGIEYAETEGRGGLGTAVVVSAGNGGCDTSEDGMLKAEGVIAVAAAGGTGEQEYYSNYGSVIDITGPAGGLVTTDISGENGYGSWDGDPDYFGEMSGTSAAAPVVSGVLALMFAANPRLTAAQARQVLCETAVKTDPIGGDYDEDGWSPYYGCGWVDAGAAVLAVSNTTPGVPTPVGPDEPTADRVLLQWAPAEDADGDWLSYELAWWVGDEEAVPDPVEGFTLDLTGAVAEGDTVSWWVAASDQWGPGEPSEVQTFVVQAPPEEPPEPAGASRGCSLVSSGGAMLAMWGLIAVFWRRTGSD